jgi:5'-3' exoribonuclease 2
MGVPGFFMWLMKQYKNKKIVFPKSKASEDDNINSVDYLLIDMNCMIHPECFKTLVDIKTTSVEKIEAKMRKNVIDYLEKIIEHNMPRKGVYLAIDGVAPVAKMKQQRYRRFKSVSDKELYDNLRKKHNKEIPIHWSNSAITPGTNFMKRLNERIIEWATAWSKKHKIEILYSSCNVPAEGEHKLLQFIRTNQLQHNSNYTYSIYGLDADLIFLALSTGLDSIYLMREGQILKEDTKEAVEGFNYVSIKILRECIVDTMRKYYNKDTDLIKNVNVDVILDNSRLVDDFIFICYLMGNDFLPHLPSLDIYSGAIDTLIEKYVETIKHFTNQYIVIREPNNCDINTEVFYNFLNRLAVDEEATLKLSYGKKKFSAPCISTDPYDIEVHRIENMKFKVADPIQLGKDSMVEWRTRYYNHYYKLKEDEIDSYCMKMVGHYMKGLKWVTCYYFDKCPAWDWYYPYDNPPFLSDMINNKYNFQDIQFKLGEPMTPFEQLLTVLPRKSAYLLPECLQKIMLNNKGSAVHLYPNKFELDMIGKKKYWMVHPILPPLEISLIRAMFNKYSKNLSSDLRTMNTNLNELKIIKYDSIHRT